MLADLALFLVYSLLSQVNILSAKRTKLVGESSGLPCGCGTNEVCLSWDTSGWKAKCACKCCYGKETSYVPKNTQSFLPHYYFFDTYQQTDTATSLESQNNYVLGLCTQSALLHFLQFLKWFWDLLWRLVLCFEILHRVCISAPIIINFMKY